MNRILLVGHSLPCGYEPGTPAFPGASQNRLCRMMGIELGTLTDYVDTVNLVDYDGMTNDVQPEDLRAGAENVKQMILANEPNRWVWTVLAGAGVAKPLGVLPTLFKPQRIPGCEDRTLAVVVPHPSGLNRQWNDPYIAERTSKFWRGIGRLNAALDETYLDNLVEFFQEKY